MPINLESAEVLMARAAQYTIDGEFLCGHRFRVEGEAQVKAVEHTQIAAEAANKFLAKIPELKEFYKQALKAKEEELVEDSPERVLVEAIEMTYLGILLNFKYASDERISKELSQQDKLVIMESAALAHQGGRQLIAEALTMAGLPQDKLEAALSHADFEVKNMTGARTYPWGNAGSGLPGIK